MQRAYRLRASADFQRVRAGRPWAHPLVRLYTAPNAVGHPRVGVSVSRQVGKAVVRNRVRRRLLEAVRLRLEGLSTGCDLVFVARGPSATASWAEMLGATDQLLRRAGLLGEAARSTSEPV